MNKIIIAVDGFSSTGKSTLARQLAQHLSYVYVDSGAMYRAVTLYAMKQRYISTTTGFDTKKWVANAASISIDFRLNKTLGYSELYLNGTEVENQIRTMEVSNLVSQVAAIPEVRAMLLKQQRKMGSNKGVVMDGRDIGTVVFPHAELKLFMTASIRVRAERRFKELLEKGHTTSYKAVLQNIQERDDRDSSRELAPLMKAKDAVEIDTSWMTPQEQFNSVISLVFKVLKSKQS